MRRPGRAKAQGRRHPLLPAQPAECAGAPGPPVGRGLWVRKRADKSQVSHGHHGANQAGAQRPSRHNAQGTGTHARTHVCTHPHMRVRMHALHKVSGPPAAQQAVGSATRRTRACWLLTLVGTRPLWTPAVPGLPWSQDTAERGVAHGQAGRHCPQNTALPPSPAPQVQGTVPLAQTGTQVSRTDPAPWPHHAPSPWPPPSPGVPFWAGPSRGLGADVSSVGWGGTLRHLRCESGFAPGQLAGTCLLAGPPGRGWRMTGFVIWARLPLEDQVAGDGRRLGQGGRGTVGQGGRGTV